VTDLDYSIWNCCYARGRLPADFMGGVLVHSNEGLAEIAMTYSVLLSAPANGARRLIVVDTGFAHGESMSGRSFAAMESPHDVLGKLGFRPSDVDTVVLTHLHFDHAGNIDAFPNADVIVQRCELESWMQVIGEIPDRSVGKSSWKLSSLDVEMIERIDRDATSGRITLIDGDAEIAPGVWCRLARDTHTFGSQWLEVATPDGAYAIAGDCVYWYANVERMWPPGYIQGNAWNLIRTLERMRDAVGADRLERIVPAHDFTIYDRHPSWVSGHNPVAEVRLGNGERSRRSTGERDD
jgi:N-acyl homoserine lactone hydrolase